MIRLWVLMLIAILRAAWRILRGPDDEPRPRGFHRPPR